MFGNKHLQPTVRSLSKYDILLEREVNIAY